MERHPKQIHVRMSEAEVERAKLLAADTGMTLSDLIRVLLQMPSSSIEEGARLVVIDRTSAAKLTREMRRWGHHYNQAVHAMNLINFHARHGHVDRDLVADSIPTIERELADVNAAAREMAAELGRIGADSLVEGSPCRS